MIFLITDIVKPLKNGHTLYVATSENGYVILLVSKIEHLINDEVRIPLRDLIKNSIYERSK